MINMKLILVLTEIVAVNEREGKQARERERER
jgi:hypothetical protein